MNRLSYVAAVKIQCWFRTLRSESNAKIRQMKYEEERRLLVAAYTLRDLRLTYEKIKRERCNSCPTCLAMRRKKTKETPQVIHKKKQAKKELDYAYDNELLAPLWQSCFRVISLVGIATIIFCYLIDNTFIRTKSYSRIEIHPSFGIPDNIEQTSGIIIQNNSDIISDQSFTKEKGLQINLLAGGIELYGSSVLSFNILGTHSIQDL